MDTPEALTSGRNEASTALTSKGSGSGFSQQMSSSEQEKVKQTIEKKTNFLKNSIVKRILIIFEIGFFTTLVPTNMEG